MGARARHAHSVLVVESFDGLREALIEILTMIDCLVVATPSGREALGILSNGLRPCLVLLDHSLPEMDGWAVWERMQAHREWSKTPVVMLAPKDVERERLRQAGIRAVLRKPLEAKHVIATVEQHCPQSAMA